MRVHKIAWGNTFDWCEGQCKYSYRECLTSRYVPLKDNGREMKRELQRNLTGLFSRSGFERIGVSRDNGVSFNEINFGGGQ